MPHPARSITRPAAFALLLVVALVAAVARAEPEGYMGGEGRPVGTPYVSGGISITVRGIAVDVARPTSTWSCGGAPEAAAGSANLVTVTLSVSNPGDEAVSTQLAIMDLVVAPAGAESVQVLEGTCVKRGRAGVTEVSLAAHRSTTVAVQFLAPRRAIPKVLVYNDDDFPALFALPAAKPARATAKVR